MSKITNRILTAPNQGLSDTQKQNARNNIGAVAEADLGNGKLTISYLDTEGVQQTAEFTANQSTDTSLSVAGRIYEGKDGIKVDGSDITLDMHIDSESISGDGKSDETKLSVPLMSGATEDEDGSRGLVPAPSAGDSDNVLTGSGSWAKVNSWKRWSEDNMSYGSVPNDVYIGENQTADPAGTNTVTHTRPVPTSSEGDLATVSTMLYTMFTNLHTELNDDRFDYDGMDPLCQAMYDKYEDEDESIIIVYATVRDTRKKDSYYLIGAESAYIDTTPVYVLDTLAPVTEEGSTYLKTTSEYGYTVKGTSIITDWETIETTGISVTTAEFSRTETLYRDMAILFGLNNAAKGSTSSYSYQTDSAISLNIGKGNTTTGCGMAFGVYNKASTEGISFGANSTAADRSFVVGLNNNGVSHDFIYGSYNNSVNYGGALIYGWNNIHVGMLKKAYKGHESETAEPYSIVIGHKNSSYGLYNFIFGIGCQTGVSNSAMYSDSSNDGFCAAIGFRCQAHRNYDIAIGFQAIASGAVCLSESDTQSTHYNGGQNIAIHASQAIGSSNIAAYSSSTYGIGNISLYGGSMYSLPTPYNNEITYNILWRNTSVSGSAYIVTGNIMLGDANLRLNGKGTDSSGSEIPSNIQAVYNTLIDHSGITASTSGSAYGRNQTFVSNTLSTISNIAYTGTGDVNIERNLLFNSSNWSFTRSDTSTSTTGVDSLTAVDNVSIASSINVTQAYADGPSSTSINNNIFADTNYQNRLTVSNTYSVNYNAIFQNSWFAIKNAHTFSANLLLINSSMSNTNAAYSDSTNYSENIVAQGSTIIGNGNGAFRVVALADSHITDTAYGRDKYLSSADVNLAFAFDSYMTNVFQCAAFMSGSGFGITDSYHVFSFGPNSTTDSSISCIFGTYNNTYRANHAAVFGTSNSLLSYMNESEQSVILGSGNGCNCVYRTELNYVFGTNNTINSWNEVQAIRVFGNLNRLSRQQPSRTYTSVSQSNASVLTTPGNYYVTSSVTIQVGSSVSYPTAVNMYFRILNKLAVAFNEDYHSGSVTYITVSDFNNKISAGTIADGWYRMTTNGTAVVNPGILYSSGYYVGPVSTSLNNPSKPLSDNTFLSWPESIYRVNIFGDSNTVYERFSDSTILGNSNTLVNDGNATGIVYSSSLIVGNTNTGHYGSAMLAIGSGNNVFGHHSATIGLQNVASQFQTVIGKYNRMVDGTNRYNTNEQTGSARAPVDTTTGALFVIGNGYAEYDHYNQSTSSYVANNWQDETYIHRSNAMTVYANGKVTANDFVVVQTAEDGSETEVGSIAGTAFAARAVSPTYSVEASESTTAQIVFYEYTITGTAGTRAGGCLYSTYNDTAPVQVNARVSLGFPNYLTDNRMLCAVISAVQLGPSSDPVFYGSYPVDLSHPCDTIQISDLLVSGTGLGIRFSVSLVEPSVDNNSLTPVTNVAFKASAVITMKG